MPRWGGGHLRDRRLHRLFQKSTEYCSTRPPTHRHGASTALALVRKEAHVRATAAALTCDAGSGARAARPSGHATRLAGAMRPGSAGAPSRWPAAGAPDAGNEERAGARPDAGSAGRRGRARRRAGVLEAPCGRGGAAPPDAVLMGNDVGIKRRLVCSERLSAVGSPRPRRGSSSAAAMPVRAARTPTRGDVRCDRPYASWPRISGTR